MSIEIIFFCIFSAHIVNPQWLLDCCEKGELLPEIDYLSSIDRDEKYRSNMKSFLSSLPFRQDSISNSTDDKKKNSNSNLSTPSLIRQGTSNFNVDQTFLVRYFSRIII
jgi:hypothetical protein